jgi:hypothetical protein
VCVCICLKSGIRLGCSSPQKQEEKEKERERADHHGYLNKAGVLREDCNGCRDQKKLLHLSYQDQGPLFTVLPSFCSEGTLFPEMNIYLLRRDVGITGKLL